MLIFRQTSLINFKHAGFPNLCLLMRDTQQPLRKRRSFIHLTLQPFLLHYSWNWIGILERVRNNGTDVKVTLITLSGSRCRRLSKFLETSESDIRRTQRRSGLNAFAKVPVKILSCLGWNVDGGSYNKTSYLVDQRTCRNWKLITAHKHLIHHRTVSTEYLWRLGDPWCTISKTIRFWLVILISLVFNTKLSIGTELAVSHV